MQMSHGMNQFSKRGEVRLLLLLFSCLWLLNLAGCSSGGSENQDYVYVAVPEASLRDRVSTLYTKTGLVHNGERLQVLERMQNKRFLRVRTPRGEEGWIQERYLADQQTFDEFQRLAQQYKDVPPQATGRVEEQVKVHVLPGRRTGYLYLLNEKEKVDLLKRDTAKRNASPAPPKEDKARAADKNDKNKDKDDKDDDDDQDKSEGPAILEDWWLIRDSQKRVGWVYGRTLYLDVPDEIAQYSEGQRIVAALTLDQVKDEDKQVPEYLVLLTENKDGMPFDYNQIRVFTWNSRKHRYETAYRERELSGVLPVILGQQDFDKEGKLRTFTLSLKRDDGSMRQQLYKFNPPIVRKVYAPGETPPPKSHRKKAEATPHRSGHQG
jgi:SH3-like domain-containing protein